MAKLILILLIALIFEAIGVVFELGEGHAAGAVGERDAIRKPHCGALQEIADRHPTDAAGTGYAAGCCEVCHFVSIRDGRHSA